MKSELKNHLMELMNDMEQQLKSTTEIARGACSEEEFAKYRERMDEVLSHVAHAKNYVLTAKTDASQRDESG